MLVGTCVERVHGARLGCRHLRSRGQYAAGGHRGGDGTGIHERNIRCLSVLRSGPFTVRKVPSGVPDAQRAVGGNVAGPETGTAEGRTHHHAGGEEPFGDTGLHQPQHDRHTRRIDTQGRTDTTLSPPCEYLGHHGDVLIHAAGASGHDPLINDESAVANFPEQLGASITGSGRSHRTGCPPRQGFQVGLRIGVHLPDGHGGARMERQCDHGLHLVEFHPDETVVLRQRLRRERSEFVGPSVGFQILPHPIVRRPYRREAGRLRRHHVDAIPEIHGEGSDAGTNEFHHPILHETALEHRGDDR